VANPAVFPIVTADTCAAPPPLVDGDAPAALPDIEFKKLSRGLYYSPPPPRAFALGGYLPKGIASKFSGPGQLGKSMIMVYAALCQAIGREFCGHSCAPGRVVYVSAEDEFTEFERRMHRLMHALYPQGLPQEVEELLDRNLEGVDLVENGTDCLLTNINRQGRVAITPFVDHVAKLIGTADLVVFDTQSRFHGGPENDNTAGAVFIRALELIAKKTGAAVCAISHVGKGKDFDSGQYDRGASELTDNARGAMKLTLLPSESRDQLTDPDQFAKVERGDIVRLVHSKNSYGPRHNDVYFERLPNGVLLPVLLTFKSAAGPSVFGPSAVDLVGYLITRVGNGEVSRNQVRDAYQNWCGPTATREQALRAFDAAAKAGWLVFSRNRRRAQLYSVSNADLIGGTDK
jgi:regulatory protein RepA